MNLWHGAITIDVPSRWTVDSRGGNTFLLEDPTLGTLFEIIAFSRRSGERRNPTLREISAGWRIEQLGSSRLVATRESDKIIDGASVRIEEQRLEVTNDADDQWLLDTAFVPRPGYYWAPSVRADAAFFRSAVRRVAVHSQQGARVAEEQSPAQLELDASKDDFATSFDLLVLSVAVFILGWLAAHLLFERKLRLSKIGYTYIGHATTLTSFVGLMLGATSFFTTNADSRMKLAEVAAESAAAEGERFVEGIHSFCRSNPDWELTLAKEPGRKDSPTEKFDCKTIEPVLESVASYFQTARLRIFRAGNFVDPTWRFGFPITLFIARGMNIISRAEQLSVDQRVVLEARIGYFFDRFEAPARVMQSQQDNLALATWLVQLSRFWGIPVALSLALGMVKNSGDRRFERSKTPGTPPVSVATAATPPVATQAPDSKAADLDVSNADTSPPVAQASGSKAADLGVNHAPADPPANQTPEKKAADVGPGGVGSS